MTDGQPPFVSLCARTLCQATEKEERVLAAMKNVLGDLEIDRESASGYHGNRILVLSVQTGKNKPISDFAKKLSILWDNIGPELEERLDEDRWLHIRFSKQAAFLGELEISRDGQGGVIDISLKARAYPATRAEALKNIRSWYG